MPLKQDIKAVLGGSSFFIDSKLAALGASLTGDAEEHTFYADEADMEELYTSIFTGSLFSEYKVIKLARAESIKKPTDFFKNPKNFISAPNAIIITCSDPKKAATIADLLGFESIVEGKQNNNALTKEIARLFTEKGLAIGEQAAGRIGAEMNWNMTEIASLAEKLSLYFAGKSPSVQEILNHAEGGAQENVFRFIDAFMMRDKAKALAAYTALADPQAEASQIFYMLTMYVAGLYFKLRLPAMADGHNPFFNGKTYFMRTVDNVKNRWKAHDAAKLIEDMRTLDVAIKTGRIGMQDALITLVGKV